MRLDEHFWTGVRLADALDVLLIAALIYVSIVWVRRSRSRFVMGGLATLGALYAVARFLDLHLTLSVFQAAVTVAVLALVVIFQEDLRRAFERIATARGPLRRPRPPDEEALLDSLVETVAAFAESRTGALLVFKGKEPLERHFTGGTELGGRSSPALLQSLFDTSSAGHDGAVVIDGRTVTRFGVHLPLSTRIEGTERFGTRHTAALGLSERSDALVVVVSEERGEISVARGGDLRKVTAPELRRVLGEYRASLTVEGSVAWWRRALLQDVGTKLLAGLLAAGAWLVVVGLESQTETHVYDVPVVLRGAPEGWLLQEPRPADLRLTLSGSARSFRDLDAAELVVGLEVEGLRPGEQRLAIRESDLRLPRGLHVERIDPVFVTVTAHQTVTREVAVRAQTTGRPARPFALRRLNVEPARVPLVLRRSDLGRITGVPTEPIDVSRLGETTTVTVPLAIPRGALLTDETPTEVEVTVEVFSLADRRPGGEAGSEAGTEGDAGPEP